MNSNKRILVSSDEVRRKQFEEEMRYRCPECDKDVRKQRPMFFEYCDTKKPVVKRGKEKFYQNVYTCECGCKFEYLEPKPKLDILEILNYIKNTKVLLSLVLVVAGIALAACSQTFVSEEFTIVTTVAGATSLLLGIIHGITNC